jgi:hypothetical protein
MSAPSRPPLYTDIDRVWAATLIGIKMAVPDSWWDGYDTPDINYGRIIAVDFSDPAGRFWKLQLDSDDDNEIYLMRYDALALYADEEDDWYENYHLPIVPLSSPEHESVIVNRMTALDLTDDDMDTDSAHEEEEDDDDDDPEYDAVYEEEEEEDDNNVEPPELPSNNANPLFNIDNESDGNGNNQPPPFVPPVLPPILPTIGVQATPTIYTITDKDNWVFCGKDGVGRSIDPIPWTGGDEDFSPKITPEELEMLKDEHGVIRYWKVNEWLLPTIGGNPYFEWLAARMRNYMVHLIRSKEYRPRYYNPAEGLVIEADHVTRFFGCHIARMLRGYPGIRECWSTRDLLDAVQLMKESMPRDAYEDMTRCLHFVDDWIDDDDEDWNSIYTDEKYDVHPDSATHRKKHGGLEDFFWKRWQQCVNFGRELTADESRVAGWLHSVMTIGPEPKPIRTGATLHSLCVTRGPMATYKLFVRAFGGKTDSDLAGRHLNCGTTQKWVNLYNIMLHPFKGRGHNVTMDSAYMGDIMAQIGRYEWMINMVGTTQSNRTGADVKDWLNSPNLKIGSYESVCWQHNLMPLCYSMWADNNIVKTLSNYHRPERIKDALRRKRKINGKRERERTLVPCPLQQIRYSETFHLIDKGNGAEAKYDLGGESKTHGWSPKLHWRYINMGCNNSHIMYNAILDNHAPLQARLNRREGMKELAHAWSQRGEPMRLHKVEHAPPFMSFERLWNFIRGRKKRSDTKARFGYGIPEQPARTPTKLQSQQFQNEWRTHQPVASVQRGRCSYAGCPGYKRTHVKKTEPYQTRQRCEDCSAAEGRNIFYCNDIRDGKAHTCHLSHHSKHFSNRAKRARLG